MKTPRDYFTPKSRALPEKPPLHDPSPGEDGMDTTEREHHSRHFIT